MHFQARDNHNLFYMTMSLRMRVMMKYFYRTPMNYYNASLR